MQWESGSASGRATCRQGLCERTTNFWPINAHFPVSVSDWNRFIVLQRVLYGRWQGQGEDWLSDKSFIASRVSCQFCCSYGREDEEVMGLRFCNEAVMCLTQIYPQISDNHESDRLTPLQVINFNPFPTFILNHQQRLLWLPPINLHSCYCSVRLIDYFEWNTDWPA